MDYDLLLIARSEAGLQKLGAQLGPDRAKLMVWDMSVAEKLRDLAQHISRECDSIDVLVHAAGLYTRGSAERMTAEEVQTVWTVNALAPFLLTAALAPLLRASNADVVYINSSIAQRAVSGLSAYGASKDALKSCVDSLRAELNQDGVRLSSIYPGRTATAMQEEIFRTEQRAYEPDLLLQPETIADVAVGIMSLPRTAEVTDVYLRPLERIA